MEPVNVLLCWDRIHPHLHPLIASVDPRIRLLWGAPLDPNSAEFRAMLAEAEILFGIFGSREIEPAAPWAKVSQVRGSELKNLPQLAPRLRWIQNIGAGVEWYWSSDLASSDIVVTTASGVSGTNIAEYVVMATMMLLKRVPERMQAQQERRWHRLQFELLAGKTILVIGLGGIGVAVARLFKGFETTVLATRRNWQAPKPPFVDEVHGPEALLALLPRADVVVISAAYTPETQYLIDKTALAAMKDTAILVNVARGAL